MKQLWGVFVGAALVGCGGAPSSSTGSSASQDARSVRSGPVTGPEELGEGGSELGAGYASDWFPLGQDNAWTFSEAERPAHAFTVQREEAANQLSEVAGLGGAERILGVPSKTSPNLFVWNPDNKAWSPFIRFGYASRSWTVRLSSSPCDVYEARRVGEDGTLTTPAGSFVNVRTIGFTLAPPSNVRCGPPVLGSLSFARGVGPVAVTLGNGEQLSLSYAQVGERAWPAGVLAHLDTDGTVYRGKADTVRCVKSPCASNAVIPVAQVTLTLTNRSSEDRRYAFTSGQVFEFEVLDPTGAVVRRWSEDRRFTQMGTELTVKAGQTITFQDPVRLEDAGGRPLEGKFTLRGYLVGGGAPAAYAPVEVVLD